MPIQSSGAISVKDFDYWFGNGAYGDFGSGPDTNVSLSLYYRAGGYVPSVTPNAGIPTAGQISMSQFYGATGRVRTDWFTPTKNSGTLYGVKNWGTPQFGAAAYIATYMINFELHHMYWDSSTNILTCAFGSGSNDTVYTNSDLTFVSVSTSSNYGSTYTEYSRGSATYTAATATTPNLWTWSGVTSNPFINGVTLRLKHYS